MSSKFNISSLYDTFTDFARPNLFTVSITSKNDSKSAIDATFEKIQFLAKGINTPTLNAGGPIELQHLNRKYKIAGDPTFEDLTMTIVNDIGFTARKYFEEWYSQIHLLFKDGNPDSGWQTFDSEFYIAGGGPLNYMRDVVIIREDRKMDKIMTITLVDAFPVSIDGIELSYETSDSVEEFSVNLSFNNVNINYATKPETSTGGN